MNVHHFEPFCVEVKRKNLQPGQPTLAKCSPPPAPTCPPTCRTWCTRTELSPPFASTCSAWRTFVLLLREDTEASRRSVCCFIFGGLFPFVHRIQKLPRLLVASSDGFLYIYNVDPQDGGECVLVQKHRYALEAEFAPVLVKVVETPPTFTLQTLWNQRRTRWTWRRREPRGRLSTASRSVLRRHRGAPIHAAIVHHAHR